MHYDDTITHLAAILTNSEKIDISNLAFIQQYHGILISTLCFTLPSNNFTPTTHFHAD